MVGLELDNSKSITCALELDNFIFNAIELDNSKLITYALELNSFIFSALELDNSKFKDFDDSKANDKN